MVYNGKSMKILLKWMIWGYLHFRKPPFGDRHAEVVRAEWLEHRKPGVNDLGNAWLGYIENNEHEQNTVHWDMIVLCYLKKR